MNDIKRMLIACAGFSIAIYMVLASVLFPVVALESTANEMKVEMCLRQLGELR